METINIDGRFLILAIIFLMVFIAFINLTASIWIENQDHRKARAWDDEKCNQNFMDWLAIKVASNPFFKRIMILCLVPFVVCWILLRYPNLFFKKAYDHFEKQVNSALNYLRIRR